MFQQSFKFKQSLKLFYFCSMQQFGRKFYLLPLAVLLWPIYNAARMLESDQLTYLLADVQNDLIGLPVYLLAIGLGVGLVAGEVEKGTLEAIYSVNGGAKRIWKLKLISAFFLLLLATLLLCLTTSLLFVQISLPIVLRVLQGAVFFLVLAMTLGAVFRSLLASMLVSSSVFFIVYLKFEAIRWSPIFNPLRVASTYQKETSEWLAQNHLMILALIFLLLTWTNRRGEQRERMLDN